MGLLQISIKEVQLFSLFRSNLGVGSRLLQVAVLASAARVTG